ncbi:MAG: type I 3-dehydroquinate dehydratase [Bacteroidota bacterium]|nr:type I 3-dehydroquinate dehydratase [Bacteroidota bacterium]
MICVSIAPKNMKEARELLLKAGKLADVVEIRVENIVDLDIEQLLSQPRPGVIITNRPSVPTRRISEDKRIALLYKAIELGAEYIDIEYKSKKKIVLDIIKFSYLHKTKIILSYHNFSNVWRSVLHPYLGIKNLFPSYIKIATCANNISENLQIFRLLKVAKKEHIKLSAFCMGERGETSRILAPRFGGCITYCSLGEGDETAPGQIPVKKLLEVYNYRSINEQTKIFGLAGNPVSHSRGIYIHNKFFKKNKLNAVYVNFLTDDFGNFFRTYLEYLQGISITIPHKEEAAKLLKNRSDEAEATGSVNTIIKTTEGFVGYNTDALAAVMIFEKLLNGKSVAVLGTGGTARSAIYAAKKCGGNVHIFGRNLKKAKILAKKFKCEFSSLEDIQKIKKMDAIINTTPVGMVPNTDASPIPKTLLNKKMLVVDFVYTPKVTKLLRDAAETGCQIIPGTKIFESQAKLQQEFFKSVI